VNAALAVGVAMQLFFLVKSCVSLPTKLSAMAARSTRVAIRSSAASAAQSVIDAHLFGTSPSAALPAEAAAAVQSLVLLGVIAFEDPTTGLAIIRFPDKRVGLFPVNAQIDAGTRLESVFRDHIVIEWRGADTILSFAKDRIPLQLFAEQPKPTVDTESEDQSGPELPPMDNLPLKMNMDYSPRMVGNQIRGFEITSVHDDEKLARIGLKMGDIVTTMNGRPINTQAEINAFLDALSHGQTVDATIVRDDSTSTATLHGG
jgi:type II secretion system protein C